MEYKKFTDEQLDRAKNADIIAFLGAYNGWTFKKAGQYYQWDQHDSLLIYADRQGFVWNSFNDIANALQIARKKVIAIINELVSLGVIRKLRVLKKDGSYSDNHYSVSDPQPQKERRDKKASPQQAANSLRTQRKLNCVCKEYKPLIASCQVLRQRLTNLYFYLSGVVP